jgi:hypothetical protein
MRAIILASILAASTQAHAQQLMTATTESFACRDLETVMKAAQIMATGTKPAFLTFMTRAVNQGECNLVRKGETFLQEKKLSNAAYCVLRQSDRTCRWMPGEAFD